MLGKAKPFTRSPPTATRTSPTQIRPHACAGPVWTPTSHHHNIIMMRTSTLEHQCHNINLRMSTSEHQNTTATRENQHETINTKKQPDALMLNLGACPPFANCSRFCVFSFVHCFPHKFQKKNTPKTRRQIFILQTIRHTNYT